MDDKKRIQLFIKKYRQNFPNNTRWINYFEEQEDLDFLREYPKYYPWDVLSCLQGVIHNKYFGKLLLFSACFNNNPTDNETIISLFNKCPKKYLWIKKEDTKIFNTFPNKITIYRGCKKNNYLRPSWSTSKKIAELMGIRLKEKTYLYKAEIEKQHVFCYTTHRGEDEVIIDPTKLSNISILKSMGNKKRIDL